jgi:flagellar hook-basal body complex protein FliE
MTNAVNNLQPNLLGRTTGVSPGPSGAAKTGPGSFSETFNKYLDEVNQLQNDASQAIQDNVSGKSDDLDGVMVAMQKSDLAFKTLMSIRTKLIDAYEELKNMPI